MNDKEFEKQRNRVKRLWQKWRTPLGIGWWVVTIEFSREKSRGENIINEHNTDLNGIWDCIFATHSDYFYKLATITAYLPVIQDLDDEKLERYFLHELMHIHLSPMKHSERQKEEELVATTLSDMILWVVKDKKLFKKK